MANTFTIVLSDNYVVPEVVKKLSSLEWEHLFNSVSELFLIHDTTQNNISLDQLKNTLHHKYENKFKTEYQEVIDNERYQTQLAKNTCKELTEQIEILQTKVIKTYSDQITELSQQLLQQKESLTQQIYETLTDKYETKLLQYKNRIDTLEENDTAIAQLTKQLEPVISRYKIDIHGTNMEKGELGENIIYNALINEKTYSDAYIKDTSKTTASGDLFMKWRNLKCLIEVKNKKQITKLDVDKFIRDLGESKTSELKVNCGIFCSLKTSHIPGLNQDIIKLEFYDNIPAIFLYTDMPEHDIHYAIACLEKILTNSIKSDTDILLKQFIDYFNMVISYHSYFKKTVEDKKRELKQLTQHLEKYQHTYDNLQPYYTQFVTNVVDNTLDDTLDDTLDAKIKYIIELFNVNKEVNKSSIEEKFLITLTEVEYKTLLSDAKVNYAKSIIDNSVYEAIKTYKTNNKKLPTRVELINTGTITEKTLRQLGKVLKVKSVIGYIDKLI